MKKYLLLALLISSTAFAGRFELVQLGTARADQYLLDTQSGKIWRSVCAHLNPTGCDYTVFEAIDVIGISATPKAVQAQVKYLQDHDPNLKHKEDN